ncbi:hypothetical protein SAMN06265795_103181 [Noviherbaspirillum humi]|uniref:Uncharacterized protein n=1 Tax=Noviherbaspirillum humi TaxID=1688639 RepID=A0A239F4R8_9BURK|nr:hypothetical protein SAMN06265795_103181 [Noviherbaspirillum humi]
MHNIVWLIATVLYPDKERAEPPTGRFSPYGNPTTYLIQGRILTCTGSK